MNPKRRLPKKNSPKTELPEKLAQAHGGALYVGGVPGHDGTRAGRRRSEVKEMLLGGAARAVPVLLAHLEGRDRALAQNAADKLLKYGLGPHRDDNISQEEIRERMRATIEIIRRLTPMDLADEILGKMREVWR